MASQTSPPIADPGQADPLDQLRDIHLPAPIESWPPAIGWWLMGALALIGILYGFYLIYRFWQRNGYRREALIKLEQIKNQFAEDKTGYLYECNLLLKRVALTHYERSDVAHLTGEAWVSFLDRTADTKEFSMGEGQVLVYGQYANDAVFDLDALHDISKHWIGKHRALTEINLRNAA